MIFGIGTDIVDISRIRKMDSLDTFAKKILSKQELLIFNDIKEEKKHLHLSKQFAAKEAVSKAFGTGISGDLTLSEIEIFRDEKGKPYMQPLNRLDDLGISKTHVSLSDEKDYAIAFVILEK